MRDTDYSYSPKGVDLERIAFFTMTVATLGSALFGAVTGSYWSKGHETCLGGYIRLLAVLSNGIICLAVVSVYGPSERIIFGLFKYASMYMFSAMLMVFSESVN